MGREKDKKVTPLNVLDEVTQIGVLHLLPPGSGVAASCLFVSLALMLGAPLRSLGEQIYGLYSPPIYRLAILKD